MAFIATVKERTEESIETSAVYSQLTVLIKKWWLNQSTRKQLAGLSDYMLKDIGISRSQAEQEYKKPFWRN